MEPQKANKLKFIRLTPSVDILFLREIVAAPPFEDSDRWVAIVTNVNTAISQLRKDAKPFSERSLKDRLTGLLANYVRDDMEALRKSGTEEEYNEREQLLQEIRKLKEESDTVKKVKKVEDKRKREKEENEGEAIRRKAMEGMNKPEVTPTKKAKFDVGEYLTKKLELETRRFEAEKEKIAAEAQEKRAMIELLGKLASDMNKKEQ